MQVQIHHAGFVAEFQGLVCPSGGFNVFYPVLQCRALVVHHSERGLTWRALSVEDYANALKDLGILLGIFFIH